MGKSTNIVPVIAALAASTAFAVEETRMINAASDGTVSVANVSGSIEISGWSRNEVEVVADLGRGVEELIVERDDDHVTIKVEVPRNKSRNISTDLVIRIPEDSTLDVSAVSADIDIADVQGEQRLHAVSGDISTEVFAADAQAETVSGDIELAGDGKETVIQLGSVSGDIDVLRVAGDIEFGSVSGDLAIADSRLDRVQGNTVNGEIVFRGELRAKGRMDFETVNGDVDLMFDGDVSARFDVETFNGGIRNCFGPEAKTHKPLYAGTGTQVHRGRRYRARNCANAQR